MTTPETAPAVPEEVTSSVPPAVAPTHISGRPQRDKGNWREGPTRYRDRTQNSEGVQPPSNVSEGAPNASQPDDITRQEGGKIDETKKSDKKKSSAQRRFEHREEIRRIDRIMADYTPEVMVSYRHDTLCLVVNLNKNEECGTKFLYNMHEPARCAGKSRVYETKRKKVKVKSDPDKFTMSQATRRPDWHKFEEAKNAEDKELIDEKVLGEVYQYKDLPRGSNLVGSMYIFNIKRNKSTGAIDKYKARLVALGNQQKLGSYDRITSSTARGKSIKLMMSLQAKTGAKSMVLDVKGAYLKSEIKDWSKEKLFIKMPDGRIYKLNKYLYGLKQSGAEWEANVTSVLEKHGYHACFDSDGKLFVKGDDKSDDWIAMSLFVDDFYVIASRQELLDNLYNLLKNTYGDVSRKEGDILEYLGMSTNRNVDNTITIWQPAYIDKMLQIANVTEGNNIRTPMAVSYSESKNDAIKVDRTNYLSLVGLINYLAILTRPDLLYSLSRVAQATSNPTQSDLLKVKRIFRYILNTRDYGLTYDMNNDFNLYCYVDASYKDGKSHYGYTISLGKGNGSFCAKSGKIPLVCMSSTEAEYVACCYAAQELTYIRRMLKQLGFHSGKPSIMMEDNMSTIEMIKGNINHKTNKHINPKFNYTRQQVERGYLKIIHCDTAEMVADLLTKALPNDQHDYLTNLILNDDAEY